MSAAPPAKAEKVPQILTMEPDNELVFRGPFQDVVTTILKLHNPSDQKVCFKVKTTAPKRYCVRPNCGLIESNDNVNVAVMLQPFEYKDPNENKRHKFLVQSVVPTGEIADISAGDVEALWKNLPDKYPIMDSKLKCVFEMPSGGEAVANVESDLGTAASDISLKEKSSGFSSSLSTTVKDPVPDEPAAPLEVNGVQGTEEIKTAVAPEPKLASAPQVKPASVETVKDVPTVVHRKPQVTSKPPVVAEPPVKVEKSAPVQSVNEIQPELQTADNVGLQLSFMVGIVLALLIGIILGKFIL